MIEKILLKKILTSLGKKKRTLKQDLLSWAQLGVERVEIPSDLTAYVMSTSFF